MVNCGIPQGSLLDPSLFSYYVNDLLNAINEGELHLYTDDITLLYIGPSVDQVCNALVNKKFAMPLTADYKMSTSGVRTTN